MHQAIPSSGADRLFFLICAVWLLFVSFAGFFDTLYFRPAFEADYGPISTSLLIHGLMYSAWVILFAVQVTLIRTNRVQIHMMMGLAATLLLIGMFVSGWYVVLEKAMAGRKSIDEAGYNLAQIGAGIVVAFIGISNYKRATIHKRLMLGAAVFLTVASSDRALYNVGFIISENFEISRPARKIFAALPLIALLAYDVIFLRRLAWLAALLLTFFWSVNWLFVSDLLFMRSEGEVVINWLAGIFGL